MGQLGCFLHGASYTSFIIISPRYVRAYSNKNNNYIDFFQALFKRMGCKIHINERLRQSLWYLGFSTAIFIYCGVSLVQNEFIDSDYHILFYETSNNSRDLLVGFLFLITFYLHTILWEAFMLENLLLGLNYMLFVFATITAYYMRY